MMAWLVVSAVWVMVGLRDEGWGDRWGVGGLGRFVRGGVCTVHRLDVIKRRVRLETGAIRLLSDGQWPCIQQE